MGVEIAAIVCTRNRASDLRRCLRSLERQTLSSARYEVVVVDNGSTDGTQEVVSSMRIRPIPRYIHEPTPGLSRSRNAGWRGTDASRVAFLDDDAIASPEWLERILDCLQTSDPRPWAVGGSISLLFEAPQPAWLMRGMEAHLGRVDWPLEPGPLEPSPWYLAGGNIAFTREALLETGGFDPGLGRKGDLLLSNEELLLQQDLQARGRPVYYDPSITVAHLVRAERLTPLWFYRRFFWQGVSDALLERRRVRCRGHGRHDSLPLAARAAGDLATIASAFLRAIPHHLVASRRRIEARCRISQGLGRLAGDLRILPRK